jgi:hypothetical protein
LINYSRDLRRTKNSEGPTHEEKDFKLRDLWDFNKNKTHELVDISKQYPLLSQTLNLLFTQANIPTQGGSLPGSSRSSKASSRRSSASGWQDMSGGNSPANSERGGAKGGAKPVNIGFG